jgi:molybdopterin molybdotransferase
MDMITFEEAFRIVMSSIFETETEIVPFTMSAGRILAEDIISEMEMPPFNRSAVDGYACHRRDLNDELEVVEVIAAGQVPSKDVLKNQCSKIMTGAIVPEGCDIVFMVEESENLQNGKIRFTGIEPKLNISYKGEDVRTGDVVLKKTRFIKPQDIAIMASLGHIDVKVKKMPRVGVLSTGDELVEPSVVPDLSKIRNSNAYQLLSQVKRAGGKGMYYGIAPDDEEATFGLIRKAIDENDIVLLTGGVSMGDFDFIPSVLKRAGVKILFDRVNVQPGKPTTFGVHSKAVVFGLPGNPVSSFIQFETIIRPFICGMMGHNWNPGWQNLPMAKRYERKTSERMGWVPVFITENSEVMAVDFHGSAHIAALAEADSIIAIKAGTNIIERGEIVSVRQI